MASRTLTMTVDTSRLQSRIDMLTKYVNANPHLSTEKVDVLVDELMAEAPALLDIVAAKTE